MVKIYLLTSELSGDRAGSFRQERWVSVFLKKGFEVIVVDVMGVYKVQTYHFTKVEQLLSFRKNILSQVKSKSGVRQGRTAIVLRTIKHALFLEFFIPSLWMSFFKLKKLGILNGKKILMVSSPPFSLSLIAFLAKKINNDLTSIVDMRDAWAMHPSVGGLQSIKKYIEEKNLSSFDFMLTVSKWLSLEFKEQYGITSFVAYNVSTHYQSVDLDNSSDFEWKDISDKIKSDKIKVLYTGSIPDGHFDLDSFVSAMELLEKQKNIINYQFIFIGNCQALKLLVSNKNIASYFVFVDHLPNIEVRSAQANADVLLFLGYNAEGNAGVVSTKLFEYLFLKRPVLPIGVKSNSDVAILLNKYTNHSISIEDSMLFEKFLSDKDFIHKLPVLNVSNDEFIESLLVDYIAFADLISDVAYIK